MYYYYYQVAPLGYLHNLSTTYKICQRAVSRTYLMVLTDGGLSGTDDELVASMRASRHTRTESGATLATHYATVRQCSSGGGGGGGGSSGSIA